MANIVGNNLRVEGSKAELQKLLKDIKDHVQYDEEFDFNFIVPMPPHQPDVSKPNAFWRGNIGNEVYEKYGTNNERVWALDNWGSKWGAYSSSLGSISTYKFSPEVSIFFNTAYTAAEDVIQLMSEKYPTLTIYYQYETEDGDGAKLKYLGGETLEEEYFEDIWDDEHWDEEEESEPSLNLSEASEEQRSDKASVLKVLSYRGYDLRYASEKLRDDKEVVTMAAMTSPNSFQYASNRLKDDKEFVTNLVQNDGSVLEHVSDRLLSDQQLISLSREHYKAANDSLALIIIQKEFCSRVINRFTGEIYGFEYNRFGFKDGIEFQWPFGFRDYSQIHYFRNELVTSVSPFHFKDFDWTKIEQYHLVKVRFVYYTNNEPLPSSKIYDGRREYFLVPYQLEPGDRVLVYGRNSVLVEDVFPIRNETLRRPIESLPVKEAVIKNLMESGIKTIEDLIELDPEEFTKIKGMSSRSTKTFKELEAALLTEHLGLKKAFSQVVPPTINITSSEEAYHQAEAIKTGEINWIKFFEIHNEDNFFLFDLSKYDLASIEKIAEDDFKSLGEDEKIVNSKDYKRLIEKMEHTDQDNTIVYLAYLQKEWSYRKIDDEYEDENLDEYEDEDLDEEEYL